MTLSTSRDREDVRLPFRGFLISSHRDQRARRTEGSLKLKNCMPSPVDSCRATAIKSPHSGLSEFEWKENETQIRNGSISLDPTKYHPLTFVVGGCVVSEILQFENRFGQRITCRVVVICIWLRQRKLSLGPLKFMFTLVIWSENQMSPTETSPGEKVKNLNLLQIRIF